MKYFTISLCTIIVAGLLGLNYFYEQKVYEAESLYKVYLQGNELGYINDDEELYNLINTEQQEIKNTYSVENVYPPSDFNIVKVNTYNENISDISAVYEQIEDYDDFTIKGYTITIKSPDENISDVALNVLNKEIFDEAIDTFVNAFIDVNIYNDYINGTQEEIILYGEYIEAMYFEENISIKENYISVNEKIFTDSSELVQYLLFGPNAVINSYTVLSGDTISTIASDNQLNTKEFLIANPKFRNSETLLSIGETVNVTLLNPVLNFTYEVRKIEEVEVDFITTTVVDNTKSSSYNEVTQDGVTGLDKVTQQYKVTNGLQSREIIATERVVIREVTNKVVTTGPTYYGGGSSSSYIYTGLQFALPTLPGAIVTSPFGEWRDGYIHEGTDFSGTGYNSPIFAIADGVVTQAGWGSGGQGNYVVINHGNNYYSMYMHMATGSLQVSVGDTVTAGQQIGGMGNTGWSFGTHLHLEFTVGEPYKGAYTSYDAYKIIFGG